MYGMGISWLLVLIYKLALTCKQVTSTIVIQNGKMWEKNIFTNIAIYGIGNNNIFNFYIFLIKLK